MGWDLPALHRQAFVLIVAAMCGHATQAAGPTTAFDIPAGNAPETLREFYLQSRVRVLYLADSVRGIQTQAVNGELEASEALARMLQGTGLKYEFESEYSAVIRPAAEMAAVPQIASTPAGSGEGPKVPPPPASETRSQSKVEEVLVTGSFIHGVFDIASPLIPVEREEMKSTAYATVQDAVWSLPLAATLSQSEVFGRSGNPTRGAGIDLRGLGHGATLVLVNGRRQPGAGTDADFVDVSNIPWSMVERIEVLPDGSSALYGSDAMTGVVNIILREDMDGAETQLRYGAAPDGAAELFLAQLAGQRWNNGQWFAGYQYTERTSLAAAHRPYVAIGDKRSFGGRDFRSVASNPGNILDPRTLQPAFAIPRGQDGTTLSPDDLVPGTVNYRDTFADADLLPDRRTHSVYLTASQNLNDQLELFAEGRYGQREIEVRTLTSAESAPLLRIPATNPFFVDPFGNSPFVLVAYDLTTDLGPYGENGRSRNYFGTLGLNAEFGASWRASLSASYGAEDLRSTDSGNWNPYALDAALADPNAHTAFNPFGDGSHTNPATIEGIRTVGRLRARSEISSIQLMADGDLLDLPSGAAKMAIGVEYREESLDRSSRLTGFDAATTRAQFDRSIAAAFTELAVPLIGNPTDLRAPPRLELSLAGRYERYDDFGRTYNPKIGMRWTPLASLKLRASWGQSFKAPNLVDLGRRSAPGLVSLRDPRSPTGRSDVLVLQGGNPDLKEERATTWTAGLDLAPQVWPGFQLSLTGYAIDYKDHVVVPGLPSVFDILFHEDEWASVITRNPSQSQIDAICSHPEFFGDPQQCTFNPPTVLVDGRKQNLAIANMEGVDLVLKQLFDTNYGQFNLELKAARVFRLEQALTKTAPAVDVADVVNSPLGTRLRGSIKWYLGRADQSGLGIDLTASYAGGYRDRDSPVRRSVDDWTTFDLRLTYRTGKRGNWMDDAELIVNAVNILNEDPPFVDRELGYDVINAQPLGRVLGAYVSKKW